jgi:REP-associated tyrosine transposase
MPLPPDSVGRRHPVHHDPVEKFNRANMVFLTVCIKNRRPILADPNAHTVLLHWWHKSTHWLAGRYVILPDHVHLFCAPGSADRPLQKWVAYWKNGVARELKTGTETFWQRDFWDVQMRSFNNYETQWEYVRHNPVRHGLVESPELWPYQGEIHMLDWHD